MKFICPLCSLPLERRQSSLFCPHNHCFDIARQGYVNLLTHGGEHGDNRQMVQARRDFLAAGHYAPLADALCRLITARAEAGCSLIDAGCGEGYYTSAAENALTRAGIEHELCGIDVSRAAAALAARAVPTAGIAVASVYAMPFADASADMVFSLFAPSAPAEYRRVLRGDGQLIVALPGRKHLWGLKELLYDTPYENELAPFEMEGFVPEERVSLSYDMTLDANEAAALFAMTPYFYNTPAAGRERLEAAERVSTPAEFELAVYRRA